MKVKIIRMTKNPIDTIASAYAITRGLSYDEYLQQYKTINSKQDLIVKCAESGHWSGFEFVDIDIEAIGFSRVFEADCIRSRLSSYEIEAGKFTEQRNFETIIPPGYDQQIVNERIDTIRQWNQEDNAKGIDPRLRRYFTHQGLSRRGRIKRNLRSWIETSHNRLCTQTQWEYRQFMNLVKKEIEKENEFLASFLKPKCEHLGYCNEQFKPCGKFPLKHEVIYRNR